MNEFNVNVRGVAHDLNNHIMILMNALDRMMILCPDEPDARQAVKAAEHCALLTSQLLPQTRRKPALAGSAVREIIGEAAMLVRPMLPSFNRIEIDCQAGCRVPVPSAALQQALVNLCLNAVEAMDGPGVIRIGAEQLMDTVILSVRDTGPGVPDELRERVFDAAFTTRSARGGNGLGLARVRETVEQAHGTITVSEVFPHGACFRMVLPALI